MPRRFQADWILTPDHPPLRCGVLTITDDKVASLEAWNGQSIDCHYENAVIIPGLVNAHTHLDLSGMPRTLPPEGDVIGWLRQVIDFRRTSLLSHRQASIQQAIEKSLQSGTTLIGDICGDGLSVDLLSQSPASGVVYLELIGLSEQRAATAEQQARDWFIQPHSPRIRRGLSPHAPYSVRESLLKSLVNQFPQAPLAMHVAEFAAEDELLSRHTGVFKPFLKSLSAWDPDGLMSDWVAVIERMNAAHRALVVHGNYLRQEQWQNLSPSSVVVYCPRTHAFFGHVQHPFLDMLRGGRMVALGTDSLASNPDLSVLNEARFVWQRHNKELPGPALLHLATQSGANALGFEPTHGSLSPGKVADFVVVANSAGAEDPWQALWESADEPIAVFVAGKQL